MLKQERDESETKLAVAVRVAVIHQCNASLGFISYYSLVQNEQQGAVRCVCVPRSIKKVQETKVST